MRNSLPHRRAERAWSQEELAKRVGVSRQTIIAIEKGRFDPRLALAFRLADVLGCRVDDLFEE
jgi:putative transcriptional regulator